MKNSAPVSQSIFNYVTEIKQRQTVLQFIDKIAELAGPLPFQQQFATEIRNDVRTNPGTIRQSLIFAQAVFDYCLLDEMRFHYSEHRYSWTDDAAVYFRFNAYKAWIPPEITTSLSKSLSVPIDHVVVGLKQHIDHIYSGIGIKGLLTPDFSFWVNSDKPAPPCCVARQELFLSLLKCGINPLASINKPVRDLTIDNYPEPPYLKGYKRRTRLFATADNAAIDGWIDKTSAKWRNLMSSESHQCEEEAILCSGGTSANEAVMYALAELTDGTAYKHLFWYFENNKSFRELFRNRISQDYKSAQIVCLNLEPTNFFRWPEINADVKPVNIMKEVVTAALNFQNKKFFLVLDVTVDPLFSLSDEVGITLPDNLIVIKTVSASKHQNGMRNYFFGAILTFCQDRQYLSKINKLLNAKRTGVGGNLLTSHKVHYPRTTQICVAQKKESLQNLIKSAIDLGSSISDWLIAPYSMHLCILPPIRFANYIARYFADTDVRNLSECSKNEQKPLSLLDEIRTITSDFNTLKIEVGDSFGLPQTRVRIWRGFGIVDGRKYTLDGIRICPGFATQRSDFERYIIALLTRLREINDEQLLQLVDIRPL